MKWLKKQTINLRNMASTLNSPDYVPLFDNIAFDDEIVENPFKDPAVKEAVMSSPSDFVKVATYEPFKSIDVPSGSPQGFGDSKRSSVSIAESTSLYTSVDLEGHPTVQELLKKQEELELKEQELRKREEELRRGLYNPRQNNWPPFPEVCPFQPCFYQDIDIEIPVEFQDIVRKLYKIWVFHEAVMVANVFGGLLMLNFTIIGLGILYFLLYTPFSYICWFRTAYKAFRADSSVNFMAFFFMFFLQFVITTMQAIGIPGAGSIGVITALKSFGSTKYGILNGIINLFIAAGFCLAATGDFLLLSKVHRIYRNTGASFAKAQEEFTRSFLASDIVNNAASSFSGSRQQYSQNR